MSKLDYYSSGGDARNEYARNLPNLIMFMEWSYSQLQCSEDLTVPLQPLSSEVKTSVQAVSDDQD